LIKRKKKTTKKEERHSGEIRITLANPLESAVKYSLNILSEPKFRDVEKTQRNYETYNASEI
jgi:hypothetical protein